MQTQGTDGRLGPPGRAGQAASTPTLGPAAAAAQAALGWDSETWLPLPALSMETRGLQSAGRARLRFPTRPAGPQTVQAARIAAGREQTAAYKTTTVRSALMYSESKPNPLLIVFRSYKNSTKNSKIKCMLIAKKLENIRDKDDNENTQFHRYSCFLPGLLSVQ